MVLIKYLQQIAVGAVSLHGATVFTAHTRTVGGLLPMCAIMFEFYCIFFSLLFFAL